MIAGFLLSSCSSCGSQRSTGNVTLYGVTCSGLSRTFVQDCQYSVVSGYSTGSCNLQEELIFGCYERSNCTDGDVRLRDGTGMLDGRVEICHQGLWGSTFVRDYWDLWHPGQNAYAMVVCRQLGYPWECE